MREKAAHHEAGKAQLANSQLPNSERAKTFNPPAQNLPAKKHPLSPSCPECGSKRVWKDGLRRTGDGDVQRWLCRDCDHRFSLRKRSENPSEPLQKRSRWSINSASAHNMRRQVCELLTAGSKNLSKVETEQKQAAGATKKDAKSLLFNFAWWQKKEGYAESTIVTRVKLLKILAKRGADVLNPESIKEAIACQKWCNKRKVNAADAYSAFLRMTGGKWDPPRYKIAEKLPFIPTEAELDALISGCGPKTSTFLQLLKETGARAGEAHSLKWTDIDSEAGTVRITPEKGSRPRIFKLSSKLLSRVLSLKGSASTRIFSKHLRTRRGLFQKQRKNLAKKLQNPRLLQIHFHTFRHWKATMEYHKTKDILHVMRILGHKNIMNTLKYTQLVDFQGDEYTSKATRNTGEAKQLIETGFDYVCTTPDEIMLFRKRK